MGEEIFSNHIGNASELTLIANIKPGFVPIPEPLTYAARLRAHLRMLSALRRKGLESDRSGVYVGPIDSLQTLQYVRWTLIENDRKMLLAVNFDRSFEPYVRRIVDKAGPLLDTILCHCTGFEGHSSDQGFDVFMEYATRHQVPVELFAAASPNLSVDDGDYYLDMDRKLRSDPIDSNTETHLSKQRVRTPKDRLAASRNGAKLALLDQGLTILRVMYENADRFPNQDADNRDDLLYWNLTDRLIPNLFEALAEPLKLPTNVANWREQVLAAHLKSSAEIPQGLPPQQRRIAERTAELLRDFQEPLKWFAKPVPSRNAHRLITAPVEDMVQPGLLNKSVPAAKVSIHTQPFRATHACLLLLRVDDPTGGAAFLSALDTHIWPETEQAHSVSLSITHSGLKTLNVPEPVRRKFPAAFREGMAERAGLLGDTDCNHPDEWVWPKRNWPLGAIQDQISPNSIDLILQIEATPENVSADPAFNDQHPLFDQVEILGALAMSHGVRLLHVEAMQRRRSSSKLQGHMNFADGISQPDYGPEGPDTPKPSWDTVKLGDLLLGHQTQLDSENTFPQFDAPLQNGTFQVIRKIKQDVAAFHAQAEKAADAATGLNAETIMAKMVGRKRNGDTFAKNNLDNSFDYQDDPSGTITPLQSHIRRANPRTENVPRILRRGFSYGPFTEDPTSDDGVDRGQIFIAYNANIAEQFEIIQRWISGGNSTGISSWHGDPLLAPPRPDGSRAFRFLHNDKSVTVALNAKPIARLKWGLYAFTPSRNGLRALATGDYPASSSLADTTPIRPDNTAATDSVQALKLRLDDTDDENRDKRDVFWKEVRDATKPVDLGDFGILVGKAASVEEILINDSNAFSVEEYRERMENTIGVQYLGLDDRKQHGFEKRMLSKFTNQDLTEKEMFRDAFDVASGYLADLPSETQSLEADGYETKKQVKPLGARLEGKAFIHAITARLSVRWLGIPEDGFDLGGPANDTPHCPRDFLASSYYIFTPHPTAFNKDHAERQTPRAVNELRKFIANNSRQPSDPNSLLGRLEAERASDAKKEKPEFWTEQKMAEYVAGSCFGLVGPVTGSFRSVFFDWIKEDKIWRLQQQLQEDANPKALNTAIRVLRPAILSSMSERPIADLLYRKTVKAVKLEGIEIEAGRKVIFSQRSAVLDSDNAERFLFGGDYTDANDKALHKCPGKTMGLAILMGAFSAIMNAGALWPEGPLSVRIRKQ